MLWPILPYTTPTHPIYTQSMKSLIYTYKYDISNYTNSIYYIYTYISYIHNTQNYKNKQNDCNCIIIIIHIFKLS